MAKSKIIQNLVLGEISEEIAINRLYVIALELQNNSIIRWCESELNGYKKDDKYPSYREFGIGTIKYSGINGHMKISNASLQIEIFDKDILKLIKGLCVAREGVGSIYNLLNSNGNIGIALSSLIGYVYQKSGIQCLSLNMEISDSVYVNVLSGLKTTIIKSLIKLEKVFGNLDNFDIDYDAINSEDIKQNLEEVENILYSDDGVI